MVSANRVKFPHTSITSNRKKKNIKFKKFNKSTLNSVSYPNRISDVSKISADCVKLISCGHVIENSRHLSDQWVRHNSQVMVICLSEQEMEARKQEEQASRLARTRDAAQALANRKEGTVFVPLAAQGTYQSHFRWALIKTLISQFFSLKLVIFEKKINGK